MIRLLAALVFLLGSPTIAQTPIGIYVDGMYLGTLADPGLQYRIDLGEIHITTREIVIGCEQDQILWDRFEPRKE